MMREALEWEKGGIRVGKVTVHSEFKTGLDHHAAMRTTTQTRKIETISTSTPMICSQITQCSCKLHVDCI